MNMYKVSVIRLHFYKIHSKDICKYAYLSDPPDMFTRRVCKLSEIQAPISSSHSHGLVWSVLWTIFHNTHKGICSIGALEQEYKMHSVCVRGELFAQVLDNKSDTSSPASCYSWGSAETSLIKSSQNLNHEELRQEIWLRYPSWPYSYHSNAFLSSTELVCGAVQQVQELARRGIACAPQCHSMPCNLIPCSGIACNVQCLTLLLNCLSRSVIVVE